MRLLEKGTPIFVGAFLHRGGLEAAETMEEYHIIYYDIL